MTDVIKEMQEKIRYYKMRIEECNKTIYTIQQLKIKKMEPYNKQTNNTPNNKVLPKGWT